ncbi:MULTISPECIES: choice-of-anchor M domain-containing protein [unclassified Streptomyces]|uniref:choice-of-anchor M domain-containing protein n=1 Tax=unclassified Streptomyces TaxID=2593676 RepID=UPI0016475B5A|nr:MULTISPECIES: choice-of-anchor M domain-containing protein [unclassified Streptomyces]
MLQSSSPGAVFRRRCRLAALLLTAPLLLGPLAAAGQADEGLGQTVDPSEKNVAGKTVLDIGHVDIGPRFVDGTWRIQARDDSQEPPVWRSLEDVVTSIGDDAVQKAPESPDFSFLDAKPGSDLHVIPQTQAPEVVWLGWNTQDPKVMEEANRGVTLTMHGVEGPGHFSVFLQNGDLGKPDVLWDGDKPGAQELWVDLNTHTHANWVFTEPGVYIVDFEVSADLVTGEKVSDRAPLRFAVGEKTDPKKAFAAGTPKASPGATSAPGSESTSDSEPSDGTAAAQTGATDASTLPTVLAITGALAVVLLAALLIVGARTRRARRIAAEGEPIGPEHSDDVRPS